MRGVYTALATPFDARGEIDYPSLTKILDQQRAAGVKGLVVCGTTGESPTLAKAEKESLFRFVFDFAKDTGLDLVAGTGTNDTRESVALTKLAHGIGYRKFLAVVPYYNRPSQAGLRAHFEAIADAVPDGTVVLYNVPGRTVAALSVDTIVALSAHPRIRALKEASGDLNFLTQIRAGLAAAGRSLDLLSGDDATYYPFLLGGGHGVISVASHVCPRAMIELGEAAARGDRERGDALQAEYAPIFRDLFVEANPGPLKWVLAKMGLAENRFRLPLVPVEKFAEEKLAHTFSLYRLESGEYRR